MVALGILAGGAYAVLHPPMLTSTALVVLPQSAQAAQAGAQAAGNGGRRSVHGDPRGDRGQ